VCRSSQDEPDGSGSDTDDDGASTEGGTGGPRILPRERNGGVPLFIPAGALLDNRLPACEYPAYHTAYVGAVIALIDYCGCREGVRKIPARRLTILRC